jgi:hypothetical protein
LIKKEPLNDLKGRCNNLRWKVGATISGAKKLGDNSPAINKYQSVRCMWETFCTEPTHVEKKKNDHPVGYSFNIPKLNCSFKISLTKIIFFSEVKTSEGTSNV